jgi:hypothetical protein
VRPFLNGLSSHLSPIFVLEMDCLKFVGWLFEPYDAVQLAAPNFTDQPLELCLI